MLARIPHSLACSLAIGGREGMKRTFAGISDYIKNSGKTRNTFHETMVGVVRVGTGGAAEHACACMHAHNMCTTCACECVTIQL